MMKKSTILFFSALILLGCSDDDNKGPAPSAAFQIENNTIVVIPDGAPGNPAVSPVNVSAEGTIAHPDRVFVSVALQHTFAGDLVVLLVAPDGESLPLIKRLGSATPNGNGSSTNFVAANTLEFNAGFDSSIEVPFGSPDMSIAAGQYQPTGENICNPTMVIMKDMSEFLEGKSVSGTWNLVVSDHAQIDNGNLASWKISFAEGALNP